jgi:hypothetical protein
VIFNISKHVEKSCTKKFQLQHICSLKKGQTNDNHIIKQKEPPLCRSCDNGLFVTFSAADPVKDVTF